MEGVKNMQLQPNQTPVQLAFDAKIVLPPPNRKSVVRMIIADEAVLGGVTVAELLSRTRRHNVVAVRQKAMFRARQETKLGYKTLGQLFNKDHSTVVTAVGRALGLRKGSMKGRIENVPLDFGDPSNVHRDYPQDADGQIIKEATAAT
jgi:Bacterial dnaA protein helix-turn-helix